MIAYEKNTEDRKVIVKRLEQLTGIKAFYTRMPRCAFEIGDYTVEKYGRVTVPEDSEMLEHIETLLEEGLVVPAQTEQADEEATEETAEEAAADETAEETAEPIAVTISLPTEGHSPASLRNLIAMVYSRGSLLSKATGGHFYCSDEAMEKAKEAPDVTRLIATAQMLEGLEITEDRISFTGFPATTDPVRVRTFTQLAALMNKLALEQKHTQARRTREENERYIFRIWLLRLGMTGPEYAKARAILLRPLSGSAAFKDQAMEERWKANRRAERNAAKDHEEADIDDDADEEEDEDDEISE